MKKIIYDFGANNGDDIPYYLLKSDFVVAVEANPILCDRIKERFQSELQAGKLALENCVATAECDGGSIDFYVHRANHVLSQLPPPSPDNAWRFDKVVLPSKHVCEIIETHGNPYYVKIDIEGYDAEVLRALFNAGIFPPFISAESHSVEAFAVLVAQGRYNAFKLVDGHSVSQVYSKRLINCGNRGNQIEYSFPYHSAGPFGDDVDGPWVTPDDFVRVLALEGFGWKDIHATNQEFAEPTPPMRSREWLLRYVLRRAKSKASTVVAALRKGLGLVRL